MRTVLRPQVEPEILASFRWYEERQSGLGRAFLVALETALGRIGESPRLAPLERFPFGVYYALIRGDLHILAVLHDARHPSVWKRRR